MQATNSPFAFKQRPGSWNLREFSDHMEIYYRKLVGASGNVVSVADNVQGAVVMAGNNLKFPYSFTMSLPD